MNTKLLTSCLTLAVLAGSASAAVVFSDSFEAPPNTDVSGQTDTAATNWVKANQGFNSNRSGLVDEDTLNFSTPFGTQAYHTRFTDNSGATTNFGLIGTLTAGQTITVSFNVATDTGFTRTWNVGLVTFADDTVLRNDVRGFDGAQNEVSTVLINQSGSVDTDDMSELVSFQVVVDEATLGLGNDIGLRIRGATSDPVYFDNFVVEVVPEPSSFALLAGCFGLAWVMVRRRG